MEAEEVQAAARSSYSQAQGPLPNHHPAPSSPDHFTGSWKGDRRLQIHTLPGTPLLTSCHSLPKARVRNQKQPCPSLPF